MTAEHQIAKHSISTVTEKEGWIENFGDLLKSFRIEREISQAELARRAEIDHSTVNRLENGGRSPSDDMVEWIIEALGLDKIQADRLIASAGFRGKENTIPYNEPEMLDVNGLLNSPDTPENEKERIREVLRTLKPLGGVAILGLSMHEPVDEFSLASNAPQRMVNES